MNFVVALDAYSLVSVEILLYRVLFDDGLSGLIVPCPARTYVCIAAVYSVVVYRGSRVATNRWFRRSRFSVLFTFRLIFARLWIGYGFDLRVLVV